MSKSRKIRRNAKPPASEAGRGFPRPAAIVLVVAVVAAGAVWWVKGRQAGTQPPVAPAAVNATNQPVPAATPSPGFEKLKGKWQRPDGGYILEIRSVESGGKLDAAYFNPKAIHVANAQAAQEGEVMKVFIELRDVNYPGSTYTLAYEAASDQFTGIYYQAARQQQFEVVFVRAK